MTHGLEHEVSDAIASQAPCDAEVVDLTPGPDHGTATRAIPDRLRRIVLNDFGWKCGVPTCQNRWWLQLHHLEPWSVRRRHRRRNLVCLCSLHHRLVHDGRLEVSREDGRLVFWRAARRDVVLDPAADPGLEI